MDPTPPGAPRPDPFPDGAGAGEGVRERLVAEQREVERLTVALAAELDGIIDSVQLAGNDDEHDPDGATNGYERAKATAMLQHAEGRLVEIERALGRVAAGAYGRCEVCGEPIGAERLDALPTTTRCASCAA